MRSLCIWVLLTVLSAGCSSVDRRSEGQTAFLELCTSAIKNPSEGLQKLVRSSYWDRNDGFFDALNEREYEDIAVMLEVFHGVPVTGRNYDRYANASDSIVLAVLECLDDTQALVPGRDSRDYYWTAYQWEAWISAHMEAIRLCERSPSYQCLVKEIMRSLREHPNSKEPRNVCNSRNLAADGCWDRLYGCAGYDRRHHNRHRERVHNRRVGAGAGRFMHFRVDES